MMKPAIPTYQLKRRAKALARTRNIQHAEALDSVAREYGFTSWSLLASQPDAPAASFLSQLVHGDMMLLGARPGQGKTRLGLQLLLDATNEGRRAVFFTFEFTEAQARSHISSLDRLGRVGAIEVFASDDIDAAMIKNALNSAAPGSVVLIDYLQILDHRRSKPALSVQLQSLRAFARDRGVILAFIAQIDRSFDPRIKRIPDMADLRLPNPIDLGVFSKACFVQAGVVAFQSLA